MADSIVCQDIEDIESCPTDNNSIGQVPICKKCPGLQLCLSEDKKLSHDENLDLRLNAIKKKIVILSGKGGVGKSTLTSSIAQILASRGLKVGVLDVDICGPSIPKLLCVEDEPIIDSQWGWKPLISPLGNIKVLSVGSLLSSNKQAVIWKGPRKSALIKRLLKDGLWGRLDFLLIDTPPGTSDEHLTVIKLLAGARLDGAIIITSPQRLSAGVVSREIKFCQKLNVPIIGIIENMSGYICPNCENCTNIFEGDAGYFLSKTYNIPFLGKIPLHSEFITKEEMDYTLLKDSLQETLNAIVNQTQL